MTNTEFFARSAIKYQNARKAAQEEYESRARQIAKAEGTEYFVEEMQKAARKRDKAISDAASEQGGSMQAAINLMRKANAGRQMKAPSEEQLRILQMLKMKENVTDNDLMSAANACKENGTCIDIINEIARSHDIMRKFGTSGDMSIEAVDGLLDGLIKSASDFLQYDTKHAARVAADHNQRLYGTDPGTLPKRPLFDSEDGAFEEIAGMTGDAFAAFKRAVN